MIDTKPRQWLVHKKRRLPERKFAMTMCIGFRCRDGLALAADRQQTFTDSHTFQECKLHSVRWGNGRAIWGYSGNYDTSKLFWQALEGRFTLEAQISRSEIQENLKQALRASIKKKEAFFTLFGAQTQGKENALLLSSGTDVMYGERCEVIGWGDSPLSRFFRGLSLRLAPLNVCQAAIAAIYFIKQEKTYNGQYVGGDTDVFLLEDSNPLVRCFTGAQAQAWEQELGTVESRLVHYFEAITDLRMEPEMKSDRVKNFTLMVESLTEKMKSFA